MVSKEYKHFKILRGEFKDEENENTYIYRYEYIPGKIAKVSDSAANSDVSLFPTEKLPKEGDKLYVVVVNYDTGDSEKKELSAKAFVWAFTDANNAKELADHIEKNYKNLTSNFKGIPISHFQWSGYFENFINAEVEEFTVGE
ncbi:MAG: hypothetical protein NZZ41_02955 [Candidatus Dojkabacteria bacterium]|nr:hypothetical protein [Candidatus Dojkabacteria bacterium]